MKRRIGAVRCLFLLLCLSLTPALHAAAVTVAREGKALVPVVVSPNASDATKAVAGDIAKYLGRISGATFAVEEGDAAGGAAIVVGRAADFAKLPFEAKFGDTPFEREDYLLRSTDKSVYLLGATDLAVSHAVWDLLHRIGYRQFFPTETWEVVPSLSEIKIDVDDRESPSFYARRIWYNWGFWGYNAEPYQRWTARNRAVQGFVLNSGHAYEAIISANRAEFDRHPEYIALVNGKREIRGDTKFCISNPGLRKLVADHAVRVMKANPQQDSISMDPSDGGGWCECPECAKMGSVSDRVVTLANAVAQAINDPALGLGKKYVGHYAYNQHSAPPTIKVHPNVMPSATTAFIGGGFTFDQVVEGWQKQGATMGVYDYLSVVDWDWNLPRGPRAARPSYIANFLPSIHARGVRFYDAESGDCWGPAGLGYYVASRVLWDIEEAKRVDAIVEDFLDKSFGTAKEPMREFYRLIGEDTQRRSPSDIVGRMYRQLDAARKATSDPAALKRIDDLILYTRHAELYYAMANGKGVSKEDVVKHAYRIRKTEMVHAYGLWATMVGQQAALTDGHPLKNETPYTAEEITAFLTEGIAKNQPVDPGFEGVEFTKELVPAAEKLKLADVKPGNFPNEAQDRQRYYIWVPEGQSSVDLKITVQKLWVNRLPKVELYSPLEVYNKPVAVDESYRADGKTNDIKLKTPFAGLHRVETYDGGDYTRIEWPKGMMVTVESSPESETATSHFRGPWTLYFYVPKGTKLIGGWASRIANWAPKVSGTLVDPDGKVVHDFGQGEDGFFKVEVPAGQDGKLWKFENSQGQRLLMTVPPYMARSGAELLLPREVVEADSK